MFELQTNKIAKQKKIDNVNSKTWMIMLNVKFLLSIILNDMWKTRCIFTFVKISNFNIIYFFARKNLLKVGNKKQQK